MRRTTPFHSTPQIRRPECDIARQGGLSARKRGASSLLLLEPDMTTRIQQLTPSISSNASTPRVEENAAPSTPPTRTTRAWAADCFEPANGPKGPTLNCEPCKPTPKVESPLSELEVGLVSLLRDGGSLSVMGTVQGDDVEVTWNRDISI